MTKPLEVRILRLMALGFAIFSVASCFRSGQWELALAAVVALCFSTALLLLVRYVAGGR